MKKLTTEQINDIIFMKNEKSPVKEICEKYHIQKSTYYHHVSPEFRERMKEYQRKRYNKLTQEQKKKMLEKKREYQRHYHKNRYDTDEEFRNKQKERVKGGKMKALDITTTGI